MYAPETGARQDRAGQGRDRQAYGLTHQQYKKLTACVQSQQNSCYTCSGVVQVMPQKLVWYLQRDSEHPTQLSCHLPMRCPSNITPAYQTCTRQSEVCCTAYTVTMEPSEDNSKHNTSRNAFMKMLHSVWVSYTCMTWRHLIGSTELACWDVFARLDCFGGVSPAALPVIRVSEADFIVETSSICTCTQLG